MTRLKQAMANVAVVQTKAIRQQRMGPLLRALRQHRNRAVPAAELAEALGIECDHETNRRRVREVVDYARLDGYQVCASNEGYWMSRNATEWREYRESQKRGARYRFMTLHKVQEAVVDRRTGQGLLFAPWRAEMATS